MSYNFLSLVNDLHAEVNEIPLTEENFNSTESHFTHSKRAINSALRQINQSAFEWPFNHVTAREDLIEGQARYFTPTDAKSVNYDSFRVWDGFTSRRLVQGDYEEYLQNYSIADFEGEKYTGFPTKVYRSPDFQYILYPTPMEGMEVIYEYYSLPVDLKNPEDVPYVPEQFRHVIITGALSDIYKFRGDLEASSFQLQEFKQAIKDMRMVYQNRYEFVRSSYIPRSRSSGRFVR